MVIEYSHQHHFMELIVCMIDRDSLYIQSVQARLHRSLDFKVNLAMSYCNKDFIVLCSLLYVVSLSTIT